MRIKNLDPWLPHGTRRRNKPVDTVVVHDTAGTTLDGAIKTLRIRGLSYHYLVDADGMVVKCAPVSSRAFHAGVSTGPHGDDVNDYSVGISLVHPNDGRTPYPRLQVEALTELIRALQGSLELQWVTTHREISLGRKTDSGLPVLPQVAASLGLRFWRGRQKE